MKLSKITLLILTSSILINLNACHDSNKLLTNDPQQAVKFLYQAEVYAAEETHFYDSAGSAYLACIQNQNHFNNPFAADGDNGCEKFLAAMAQYAQRDKNFNGLTVGDLKDPAVAKRLQDDLFNYELAQGQN